MFILLLLLSISESWSSPYCKHETCGNASTQTTIVKWARVVEGRYRLDLCMAVPRPTDGVADWTLQLYADDRPQAACTGYNSSKDHAVLHSAVTEQIAISSHCVQECHNVELDLIFRGCYVIKSKFTYGSERECTLKSYINSTWIENDIHGYKNFTYNKFICTVTSEGNNVTAHWYSKTIPITTYDISLEKRTLKPEDEANMFLNFAEPPVCKSLQANMQLECQLTAVPPGNYTLVLQLAAPWTRGRFFQDNIKHQILKDFSHETSLAVESQLRSEEQKTSTSGHTAMWATLGCAAALVLVVIGLVCARRPARAAVLKGWRERYKNLHMEESKKPRDTSRSILLLYARDCTPFMDAMRYLRLCLQNCCSDKVYDLFDIATQTEIATSATDWLYGLLQRDDVRVVFVETPVAAEIYNATILQGDDGFSLRSPLLGSRVLYRTSRPADTQLQYAVRLLKQMAHAQLAYRKYYIASVNMTTEVLPNVAPLRRYPLPGGARLLLEHVTGAPVSLCTPMQDLDDALHRYTQHVAENPDYVRDILLLV